MFNDEPERKNDAVKITKTLHYCPDHFAQLTVYTRKKRGAVDAVQYRKCPVKGCKTRKSSAAESVVIPTKPTTCGQCRVPMVVKEWQPYKVVLKCGRCKQEMKLNRPDIPNQMKRRRNLPETGE